MTNLTITEADAKPSGQLVRDLPAGTYFSYSADRLTDLCLKTNVGQVFLGTGNHFPDDQKSAQVYTFSEAFLTLTR
tara:strand:- start:1481 stop:1708 length:228 start_codon:yes stop_codon:yes gene_type:complete